MRDMQLVLERWGVWSRSRPQLGYSSVAAGFKGLLPENAVRFSCSDDDAMIVDSCVGKLKQKRPDEHQLIEDHYIKGISKRMLARRMQVSEGMVRIKLQLAEGFVEGCLTMMDAELEMDSWSERKSVAHWR